MFKVGIITASDKGSRGEREDKSGELIKEIMSSNGYEVAEWKILPDERELISKELINMSDDLKLDLILTTGGTGFSLRDRPSQGSDQSPRTTQTPRSTQSTGLFKRASEGTVMLFKRVFSGEGAIAIFRVILNYQR